MFSVSRLNIGLITSLILMIGIGYFVVKLNMLEAKNEKLERDVVVKPIEAKAEVYHEGAENSKKEIAHEIGDYNFTIPDTVVWDDYFDGLQYHRTYP